MVTQEVLKDYLSYDSLTGVFEWIKSYRNQKIGKKVGSYDKDGYLQIKLQRKIYRSHRLAWLYVYGKFPDGQIDHIDGVRDNNAIANLREVTFAGNSQNQRISHKDSSFGMLGIDYNKSKNRFRARIQTNGKRITLGGFATAEEAFEAYKEAKRKFHKTCVI
jgi:hypothetical protein